jgi:alkylated DNA repair dioxygenase AlkB
MDDVTQPDLFERPAGWPAGFKYHADLISPEQERALVAAIEPLPFKEFEFHGFLGKRRVVYFGWRYDFSKARAERTQDMPSFLLALREQAAAFAGLRPADLQQVLVTEYKPGATIGWHKDRAVFGEVVGISLLTPSMFRLRRKHGDSWQRVSIPVAARSAYLLQGASRTDWEHSIAALDRLRYSITFRNFREG